MTDIAPAVQAHLATFKVATNVTPPPARRKDPARAQAIRLVLKQSQAGTSIEVPADSASTWSVIAKSLNRSIATSKKGASEGNTIVHILS